MSRRDWPLCTHCSTAQPKESFFDAHGRARKTCNNCRARRAARRARCICNTCSHCRNRLDKLKDSGRVAPVFSYKYEKWEIMGSDNAYFLPLRVPLTEIANLYDFSR